MTGIFKQKSSIEACFRERKIKGVNRNPLRTAKSIRKINVLHKAPAKHVTEPIIYPL